MLPVSVADAKKHLEIATSDTSHDDHLADLIDAAREQVEQDTQYIPISQTFQLLLDKFPDGKNAIAIPIRPITSLVSISYTDGSNPEEDLAKSVADLDIQKRRIVLQHDQEWPACDEQTDAVVITVVAGYASQTTIPRLLRQMILLQVGKWFEDRDMMMSTAQHQSDIAYERLVKRLMRSSYP